MDGDLKPLFPGSKCRFSVCCISGDKTKILTNCLESSKCVVLWSLESGSEVDRILANEDILSFAWSGDGRLLAISHSSGVISLYDVMCNFRKLTQMATPDVCGVVKFSPDHRFIFSCFASSLDEGHVQDCRFYLKVVKKAINRFSLKFVSDDEKNFDSCNDCGFLLGDTICTDEGLVELKFGLDKQRVLRSERKIIRMMDAKYVYLDPDCGFLLGDTICTDEGLVALKFGLDKQRVLRSERKIIRMMDAKYLDLDPATEVTGIPLSLDGQTVYVGSGKSVTAYNASSRERKGKINWGRVQCRPLFCPVRGGVLILKNECTVELWSGNLA